MEEAARKNKSSNSTIYLKTKCEEKKIDNNGRLALWNS